MRTKFINDPEHLADEILEGFGLAWKDYVEVHDHSVIWKGLLEAPPRIVTLYIGGAGHEPGSLAFIGEDWENVRVLGDIFAAPSAKTILDGIQLSNRGKGVFFYCGNHEGDVMAAKVAVKMARRERIDVELFVIKDDCSVYGRDEFDQRRHICTGPILSKMLGAASSAGYSMAEMRTLAERFTENVAALSVANRGATHPVTGQPLSVIPEGKMVIGMGHHGEGAKQYLDMRSSRETVMLMASQICGDIGLREGDEVIVMINGAGSTSYSELMVVYKDACHFLRDRGIHVCGNLVGSFTTTMEQGGFAMGLVRADEEMKRLFNAPCRTPYVTKI